PDVEAAATALADGLAGRGLFLQRHQDQLQLVTDRAQADVVRRVLRTEYPSRLSPAAYETLAIIAYRQPLTRARIEEIRGVNCEAVLESLEEKGLITETGRLDAPGTPRLFGTTMKFLQILGLSGLDELPGRLMHPRYHVEKEYRVVVTGQPHKDALRQLSEGMVVSGERFEPAEVRVLDSTAGDTRLSMVLREGRKREVRRLWQALGHPVLDLQRVRIDGLTLGDLPEGGVRPLNPDELSRLRSAAGL